MTRKEEIKEMAITTASHITSDKDMQVAFADALRRGAEWADSHPRWVSVEDEMPKDGEYVLICNKRGLMTTSLYENEEWVISETYLAVDVTHWMPMPKLPVPSNSENTGKDLKGGKE